MTSQKTKKNIEHGVVWDTHFHNDKSSPLQSWCPNMTTWVIKCDKTLSEVRATRLTPINPTCCNRFQAEPPCDIDNNVEGDDANTYPMIWDYCHAKLQQAERPLLSAGLSWRVGAHASRKKHQTRGSSTFDPTWPGDSTTGSQALRKYQYIIYTVYNIYIYHLPGTTCISLIHVLWYCIIRCNIFPPSWYTGVDLLSWFPRFNRVYCPQHQDIEVLRMAISTAFPNPAPRKTP